MTAWAGPWGVSFSRNLTPDTATETLLLYALSTLNFLAIVTLFFVLLRNVLTLVRERRAARLAREQFGMYPLQLFDSPRLGRI